MEPDISEKDEWMCMAMEKADWPVTARA